jgi:hypothetical protein
MKTARLLRLCAALFALGLASPAVAGQPERAASLFQFDGASGYSPAAGVIAGPHGTIFGTTTIGGTGPCTGGAGCGTVYSLSPPPAGSKAWVFDKLYDFQGGQDGASPNAQLTLGPDGSLFGYTTGGTPGTVFQLLPPTEAGKPWQFNILYVFTDKRDGNLENVASPLVLHGGALYGIASGGVDAKACLQLGCGSVFRLTLRKGATAWTEDTLFRFTGPATSGVPTWIAGAEAADTLYVSTALGDGAVVQLVPPASPGEWSETMLTRFAGGSDGHAPGNLVLAGGTLYGLAAAFQSGFAFALAPPATSGGAWTRTRIATIRYNGYGPVSLAPGAGGTLIGAIEGDFDFFAGSVFRLTPPASGTAWTVAELWNFNRGPDRNPLNVVTGRNGHLFGVLEGGDSTNGSLFELY